MADTEEPWGRVSAVLDELVAARERLNREREAATGRGEEAGPEQFIPSIREIREALILRDGRGLSYRDLGPLVARYVRENRVTQRLKPRPGQVFEPPGEEPQADQLPDRIRRGVDRAFGAMAAQREALVRLLADEVATETEALRRRLAALEADGVELHRQLADQQSLAEDADRARAEQAEAAARLEEESRARAGAEAALREAGLSRAAALAETRTAMEAREAAEARRDEMVAAVERLSAEVARAGREREEDRRRIADLTARLEALAPPSAASAGGDGQRTSPARAAGGRARSRRASP